jgi:hypothetical protein
MIHIFFVPGMFGSTIEYVLSNYTKELNPVNGGIMPDGSIHSFYKKNHILNAKDISKIKDQQIHTPIYPFEDLHFEDILKIYPISNAQDRYLLMYANDFASAELNILFQYHKISKGLNKGWEIFTSNHVEMIQNIQSWNTTYQSYNDMQLWEFREWFSLFYPTWIQEWKDSQRIAPEHWLKISNMDMLTDTENTLKQIINYCGLTAQKEISEFSNTWKKAQQYIINEYNLITDIVNHTLEQKSFTWQPINLIAESLVQQKLRSEGFDIRCDGLNIFPTNSLDLYKLLDSNIQLHQQGNI